MPMPRVKHILKSKEVIEAWLNQSQDWARNSSGSVRFEGPMLFGDRGEVCLERRMLGNGHIVFIQKSYGLPSHRFYSEDGYDAERMAKDYAIEHPNCMYANSVSRGIVSGLVAAVRRNLPYYHQSMHDAYEKMQGRVELCVEGNFRGLHTLRTFLRGAGIETLEQLGPQGITEDNMTFVRELLFGKVDATRYFRQVCNYDFYRREMERSFGEGTLEQMLQTAIAKYSHLLSGDVQGGCEYASVWARI